MVTVHFFGERWHSISLSFAEGVEEAYIIFIIIYFLGVGGVGLSSFVFYFFSWYVKKFSFLYGPSTQEIQPVAFILFLTTMYFLSSLEYLICILYFITLIYNILVLSLKSFGTVHSWNRNLFILLYFGIFQHQAVHLRKARCTLWRLDIYTF